MDPRGNPLPSSWAEDSAVEVSTLGMPPVASSAASAASLHTASETSSRAGGARVEEMVFDDPRDGGRWNRSLVRGYFSEAPLMHAIPTMYVIGASTFAVSLLTYFLQTTVVNATGHVSVFFFGAFTCFSSYYMAAHFLGEHARSFQRITPDKKMYTVSNLIKAGVLAALTPLSIKALSDGMLYDDWNTNTIRNLGCIYAIPDFVSLIVVRRMSTSTVIHHIVVLIFCVFSLWNDFSQHNVFRGIAVYAVFSTFGYVVYMLLATRFLGVSQRVARAISSIALFVYLGSCGINWAWQVTYLRILYEEYHHWSIYPYLGMLTLVVYDDMNLCRWLLHNTKSHRAARSSTAATRPLQQTQPALPIHTASMSAGHTASPASRLGGSSSAASAPTS